MSDRLREAARWHEVLQRAQEVCNEIPLYLAQTGTPLENDIPVWMATFAQSELRAALDAEPEPFPTNEERAPFTPERCVRFLQLLALISVDDAQARQNVDNAAQIVLNALDAEPEPLTMQFHEDDRCPTCARRREDPEARFCSNAYHRSDPRRVDAEDIRKHLDKSDVTSWASELAESSVAADGAEERTLAELAKDEWTRMYGVTWIRWDVHESSVAAAEARGLERAIGVIKRYAPNTLPDGPSSEAEAEHCMALMEIVDAIRALGEE